LTNKNDDVKNKVEELQSKLINTEQIMFNKVSLLESEHGKVDNEKDRKILDLETEIKRIQIENASMAEIHISQSKNDLAKQQLDDYKKMEQNLRSKFEEEFANRLVKTLSEKEAQNRTLIHSKLEEITKETVHRLKSD